VERDGSVLGLYPDADFIPTAITIGIFEGEELRGVQGLVNVANEMKEPCKGNGSSVTVGFVSHCAFVICQGC